MLRTIVRRVVLRRSCGTFWMLEAGFEAGEDIVGDEALQIMVLNMFDPPEDLASARFTPCALGI